MKKGAGHIEIILAFVMFAAVVGFALYFFSPTNIDRITSVTFDYIEREISSNVSIGVESFSVKIVDKGLGIPNVIAIDVGDTKEGKNVRVEDSNGNVLSSKKRGNIIDVEKSPWSDGEFIFLKFSEDFPSSSGPSDGVEGYSEIASSSYEEVFSEKKILELNKSYYENYNNLKTEFNIPDRTDFGFEFVFSEDDFIKSEKEIPENFEVYADSKRVEILRTDGKIVFADFVMKIW